eukprot:219088_1
MALVDLFNYKLISLSLIIPLSAVVIQQLILEFIVCCVDIVHVMEFIVCCVCIQKLQISETDSHIMFRVLLRVSVALHFCCFVLHSMFEDHLMHSLRYIQYANVLFGIVVYLNNPCDGSEADGSSDHIEIRTHPPFDIEDRFMDAATSIYNTVMELEPYNLDFFAQIVAEYGATQYVNCNECKKRFGFVECWNNDLIWDVNIILFNKVFDIIYYLVCEVKGDMLDEEVEYDYIGKHKEILCYECGEKWRCYICKYQTFGFNWMDELMAGGCYYCKKNICGHCCLYVASRKVAICEKCYVDYDICEVEEDENGTILDILN